MQYSFRCFSLCEQMNRHTYCLMADCVCYYDNKKSFTNHIFNVKLKIDQPISSHLKSATGKHCKNFSLFSSMNFTQKVIGEIVLMSVFIKSCEVLSIFLLSQHFFENNVKWSNNLIHNLPTYIICICSSILKMFL